MNSWQHHVVAGLLVLAAQACGEEFEGGGGGAAAAAGATTSTTGTGATGAQDGGTGGVGASSGGGGSAGGVVGIEDCLNGVDDDGDSYIDCADEDCQGAGFECRMVPAGWLGPVALLGPDDDTLCDAGWQSDGWIGGTGALTPTPACEECPACDPPSQAGDCPATTSVTAYGDDACASGGMTFAVSSGSCTTFAANRLSFEPAVPQPNATGVCGTTPGVPAESCLLAAPHSRCVLPEPTLGGGCGLESTCVPSAPSAATCVYQVGDAQDPCPASFPERVVLWAGVTDLRSCSCTCSFGCSARLQLFDGNECTGGSTLVDADGQCHAFSVTVYGHAMKLIDPGGVCRHNPPELDGACGATDPVTYCCLPASEG